MKKGRGQQEMVGFVLIVVLVVVALMVFLVLSIRQPAGESKSVTVENLLSAVLETTTECVVREPFYENTRDLIKDCYEMKKCANLNAPSCDYLNATISSMVADLAKTDNSIGSYEFIAVWENEESRRPIALVSGGVCNRSVGRIYGAQEMIATSDGAIMVRFNICSN